MESCLKCRKFNDKLFLKGERCFSPKCAVSRRQAATTGTRGKRFSKKSEYGIQLAEKQKAKAGYGLRERQFRATFMKATKSKEATGEVLLQYLEMRLDNVIYRSGWAQSRAQARQIVNHGHITVNGKKVDIPSYQVKIKDIIETNNPELIKKVQIEKANAPKWIKAKETKIEIIAIPAREDIDTSVDEQLIVEYYSR